MLAEEFCKGKMNENCELKEVIFEGEGNFEGWERAGFNLKCDENSHSKFIAAGNFIVRHLPADGRKIIIQLASDDKEEVIQIGNIEFQLIKTPKETSQTSIQNNNQIFGIDHLVFFTNNLIETLFLFETKLSLKVNRIATNKQNFRQSFIFFGKKEKGTRVIFEIVENLQVQNTKFFGLTFITSNMTKTKQILGENGASEIRAARQRGKNDTKREILTLRHKYFQLPFAVAIITPHDPSLLSKL